MKRDIPRARDKKRWSLMIRTVSFSLGLLVVVGSLVLANKFQKPRKAPLLRRRQRCSWLAIRYL